MIITNICNHCETKVPWDEGLTLDDSTFLHESCLEDYAAAEEAREKAREKAHKTVTDHEILLTADAFPYSDPQDEGWEDYLEYLAG